MRIIRIIFIILFISGMSFSQPSFMVDLGVGFYEPALTGIEDNEQFPLQTALTTNVLLDWGVSYQIFHNTRLRYTNQSSHDFGKIKNEAMFYRSLVYQSIFFETFFIAKKRMEWNFSVAPIWSRGSITLNTRSNKSQDDWNNLLDSFGNPSITLASMDAMKSDWFGFSSMIGFRYYILSWMAADVKMGYMYQFYDPEQWRLQGQQVYGPELDIDELPILTAKLVFCW